MSEPLPTTAGDQPRGGQAIIDRLRAAAPEVVDLARLSAMATLVEPALLRRLRLALMPAADAGTEADLWFSPLVASASSAGFVLRSEVAQQFRTELATFAGLHRLRKLVQHAHSGHPDHLQLEEDVIWATIRSDPDAVEGAMARVTATLAADPSGAPDLMRWFSQARRRMPATAVRGPGGLRLLALSALYLDRLVPPDLMESATLPSGLGELAPATPVLDVDVQLAPGRIRFGRPSVTRTTSGSGQRAVIEVPDTVPPVVEVRWVDQSGRSVSRVVDASAGGSAELSGHGGSVELRTLTGRRYRAEVADRGQGQGARRRRPSPTMQPYFFLGYAHTPERAWVQRFGKDLSNEIIERTNWPTDVPPGFMDESGIRVGEDWRAAVSTGLATCRVLVPLYSRRYFTRVECGREWYAFGRRMAMAPEPRVGPAPIVPALWTPVADRHIPDAAQQVQADFGSVHRDYGEEGLYTLIKNRRYRTAYLTVVERLAVQIIEAAENEPLAPCWPDEIDVSVDAFAGPPGPIPANRWLSVMIAAPTVEQLPPGRSTGSYGPAPRDWAPFASTPANPVAELVARLARSLGFEPVITDLDAGLDDRDWLNPESGLGLIVLDPWLGLDPAQAVRIRRIGQQTGGRVSTVSVWNLQDGETRLRTDDLSRSLAANAPELLVDPGASSSGHLRVSSPDELLAELPGMLERAASRYRP